VAAADVSTATPGSDADATDGYESIDWTIRMMLSPIDKAKMMGIDPRLLEQFMAAQQMQMPEMPQANTAKVKGPNLWDKIQGGLMPVPAGMEGLLSEEEIKAGRGQGMLAMGASLLADSGPKTADQYTGLGASLGKAIQAGQGAMQQPAANKMAVMQMQAAKMGLEGKQMEIERAKALAGLRKQIVANNPMPKNGDMNRMRDWIDSVLPQFIEANDEETVAKLSQIRSTMTNNQQGKEPGDWVTVPGPDGQPMRRYVTASQAGQQGIPEYQKPQRDTDDALTINSRIINEERITKNYDDRIAGVQETADAFISAKAAEKMGGAGDLQILYNFITALDPQSVVREGEIALARQAASLYSQAHILKNKLETQGGNLSPIMRKQMIDLMGKMVELKTTRAELAMKDSGERAKRFGLEVNLYDPLTKYRSWKASQKPAWHPPMARQKADAMFPERQ
jgi:hypothetical protein